MLPPWRSPPATGLAAPGGLAREARGAATASYILRRRVFASCASRRSLDLSSSHSARGKVCISTVHFREIQSSQRRALVAGRWVAFCAAGARGRGRTRNEVDARTSTSVCAWLDGQSSGPGALTARTGPAAAGETFYQ
jgi:hypothetical protein